jgi:hypothetical protein
MTALNSCAPNARASNYLCFKATDSHDSLRQFDLRQLKNISCPGWTPKTALFKAVRHIATSKPVRHDSMRQIDLERLTHLSRPSLRLASRASAVYFMNHCTICLTHLDSPKRAGIVIG